MNCLPNFRVELLVETNKQKKRDHRDILRREKNSPLCRVHCIGVTAATAAAAKSLQSCLTLCDPIDDSPSRLPCPWDSPGKNTVVGCHFLLQCVKVKSSMIQQFHDVVFILPNKH